LGYAPDRHPLEKRLSEIAFAAAFSLALPKEKAWQKERLVVGDKNQTTHFQADHGNSLNKNTLRQTKTRPPGLDRPSHSRGQGEVVSSRTKSRLEQATQGQTLALPRKDGSICQAD
jgi:hypothetical protein